MKTLILSMFALLFSQVRSQNVGIATNAPQTATIILPFGQILTAPTTVPTLADTSNPFVVTTDAATGVSFFAGTADDPFFFDIPAFNRFVASVVSGAPNAALGPREPVFRGFRHL